VLQSAQQKVAFELTEVDIIDPQNREYHDKYLFDVPVIHLDGKEIFRHRVNEAELLSVLRKETSDEKKQHK